MRAGDLGEGLRILMVEDTRARRTERHLRRTGRAFDSAVVDSLADMDTALATDRAQPTACKP